MAEIITKQEWKIGDCLELLPEIETGSIDMILCDLPYGTTACAWDTIIPLEPLWKEYNRIIKDNAAIVLTASQPFTTDLINSNREMFKYCWYWLKEKGTNYANAGKMPIKTVEECCVFYKSLPTYNPNKEPLRHKTIKKQGNTNSQSNKNSSNLIGVKKEYTHKTPINVLCFSRDNGNIGVHPTQKPVALFEYLIKTYTNEGDTVHDSCLGSGTTLEACRKTNRNCIGFEISDEWEHLYADRCMKHTPPLQSYFSGKHVKRRATSDHSSI